MKSISILPVHEVYLSLFVEYSNEFFYKPTTYYFNIRWLVVTFLYYILIGTYIFIKCKKPKIKYLSISKNHI